MTLLKTKEQCVQTKKEELERLIEFAGGPNHLAKMLGTLKQYVSYWRRKGQITPNGLLLVVQHPLLSQHFTKEQLRPDLYFDETDTGEI
jgi:hypothetical protein